MSRLLATTCCLMMLGLLLGADTAPKVNLLKNGELTDVDAKGSPKGWTLYAVGQDVSTDVPDPPEAAASSLRIVIKTEGDAQGSVAQKLKDLPPHVKLTLTADVKATADGIAFLQIKGKSSKQEVFRTSSPDATAGAWRKLTMTVDTGEADELSVQCRFRQGAEAVGQTVWFANVQLVQAE